MICSLLENEPQIKAIFQREIGAGTEKLVDDSRLQMHAMSVMQVIGR